MTVKLATVGPDGSSRKSYKGIEPRRSRFTALETLAAAAAAADPVTASTERPTMESGRPTREIIQPARPHASASASGNGQGSSSSAYHHRDCIVSRTVNLHSPYLPETPDPILGQVWIDHIDSMLGVRTERQTEEMRYCIEQTDRIVRLADNILKQQKELLACLRRMARGCDSDDSSTEISGLFEFSDSSIEQESDGDDIANGCSAVNGHMDGHGTADE
ncbi:hypothetical protein DTO006G1_9205 [Penicillium roqueforti]|nr:uncharacterized protein LCP9604111_9468 [Penicillium roqueforti]KAF9238442.1 hypothetical protein LCP9604111_9468 [Penicillium roqueforti]KAI1830124.1 hypothetical protein CBS147337_9042 [Penicillium roqueforti]KAI2675661.1 hypothetical protein LCP963914a_8498 [Penicillium roqueforti]KAI2695004.1 hypothetical protein CBS147372_9478 [Penicillium roqueforti]KAI2709924.1 hypothetical protein CBS147354_8755 [Penicillium roqueforti]